MMAALIFAISMVTLFMFFVSYCRSMMASAARQELSEEVRDVTGIGETASAQDYARVVQILELCPERPEDRTGLRAVGFYHTCLMVAKDSVSSTCAYPEGVDGTRTGKLRLLRSSCLGSPHLVQQGNAGATDRVLSLYRNSLLTVWRPVKRSAR